MSQVWGDLAKDIYIESLITRLSSSGELLRRNCGQSRSKNVNCFAVDMEELKVTLVVYSGLPDPVWMVHSRNEKYKEIMELLDNARAQGNTYRHKNIPAILGFKGFLVHQTGAEHAELILGKETANLQKLLLDTMPKKLINEGLCKKIIEAIDSGAVSPSVPDATQHALAQDTPQVPSKGDKIGVGSKEHYAPKYNPDRWNGIEVIRTYNNCYNYANQKITNSFAQPGFVEGYHPQMTPDDLIHATELDGLVKMHVDPSAPCPEAPPQPNCLIALMCYENTDFHCLRLDDSGKWSQKLGQTAVTDKDGDGKCIEDPRHANTGSYTFVTFMKIFTNIIDGPLHP